MPLIVITGFPSSGKTKRTQELLQYFKKEKQIDVDIISENAVVDCRKNEIFRISKEEKDIRSFLKSEVIRLISKERILILDGLNYIKGYRYELHCLSKQYKTTQCTISCVMSSCEAWNFNESRHDEKYNKEIFEGLIQRYECPDSQNRWDSPLFSVLPEHSLAFSDIYDALFLRKPPPPNQSTQIRPLTADNFLYKLDQVTQVTLLELTRARRQFILYTKSHNVEDSSKLSTLFVQYLNKTLIV